MYRILILLGVLLLFQNCEKNFQRNPFLQEAKFSTILNLNLPEYNKLRIERGVVQLDNVGLRGIVVVNILNNYMAWDRACPSQALSDCSQMTLESDHFFMLCPCNGVKYNLLNGQPQSKETSYPMLNYQVVKRGDNVLEISN